MNARLRLVLALAAALVCSAPRLEAAPLGSTFTYQGQIQKNAEPYSGTAQLLMRLYDAETAGAQIGPDANLPSVPVASGLFTVELDFGAASFNGDARWLEIRVRTAGDPDYTLLTPRQKVTAVPYGLHALSGGTGGSQWISDGPDLTYPTGGVGVTGASSPFAAGKGVFMEGGNASFAHVFGFDYDTFTPVNLALNWPGGNVGIGAIAPEAKLHVIGSPAGIKSEASADGNIFTLDAAIYGAGSGGPALGPCPGVYGVSSYGNGVEGTMNDSGSYGGYFLNTAGGAALYANGLAKVRTLDIIGGADIVEGFETGTHPLEPGSVVVIDEDHPGELRASRRAYDHHVAGVVWARAESPPGSGSGRKAPSTARRRSPCPAAYTSAARPRKGPSVRGTSSPPPGRRAARCARVARSARTGRCSARPCPRSSGGPGSSWSS